MADRKRPRTFNAPAGSRIKHLKKPDGEPLWRSDIQYDFLSAVFHDQQRVFTNYYTKERNQTFAEVYIDAMARSSKCSKVLCERLRANGSGPLNIAMVCIMVNIGRMNTTLNFFPEMKAQLRTYHPIPSLQSGDQLEYKQLQDAPRLKSILKGACEGDAPESLEELFACAAPRTNPINLIFILSSSFVDVEERFFAEHFKYSDLIMSSKYSSESRARAFLWLCWACLESDLTAESLFKNPFGFSTQRAPPLVLLTPSQVAAENVDPGSEVNFGNQMLKQRLKYLETGKPSPKKVAAPLAPVRVELAIPVAGTPRDKRVQYEFRKLVREKRVLERRRRHVRGLKRAWDAMKDLNPIYNSDEETFAQEGCPGKGLAQYGISGTSNGDYGEFFATMSKTLERSQALAASTALAAAQPANQ